MSKPKPTLRRCIVCRKSSEKEDLLRFVEINGGIGWDREKRQPGRGAYVHTSLACWSKMTEQGMWEHALRLPKGSLDRQKIADAAKAAREGVDAGELPRSTQKVRL
jgi:predicted RNA-binding protein YlxR (DUF448 family)